MSLNFNCSVCTSQLGVPDNAGGKNVRCPKCGNIMRAPISSPIASNIASGTSKGTLQLAKVPNENSQTVPTASASPANQTSAPSNARQDSGDSEVIEIGFDDVKFDEEFVKTNRNPYASPTQDLFWDYGLNQRFPLASYGKRLVGKVIDTGLVVGAAIPGLYLGNADFPHSVFIDYEVDGPLFGIACAFVVSAIIWGLVATQGQSPGKILVGTRIVKQEDGSLPGFVNGVVLRSWIPLVINALTYGIFMATDWIPIVQNSRKCIHDMIAKTVVVDVRQPSPELN